MTFDLDIFQAGSSWHYLGKFDGEGRRSKFKVTGWQVPVLMLKETQSTDHKSWNAVDWLKGESDIGTTSYDTVDKKQT